MANLSLRVNSILPAKGLRKSAWRSLVANRKASSFYVLAPELPLDTEQSNAVLRYNENPSWDEINPVKCVSACAKRSIEFEVSSIDLFESIKKPEVRKEIKFSKLWEPIERKLAPLNFCLRTTKHMAQIKPSYNEAFTRGLSQVEEAKNCRWISKDFYLCLKHIKATQLASMTEQERRLLQMYLLRSQLSGIDVIDQDSFSNSIYKLNNLKKNFRSNVDQTEKLFVQDIENFDVLVELPRNELLKLSLNQSDKSRGPWRVTLASYDLMMKHCGDRLTRWNLWRAWNNRASNLHPQRHLSNHNAIEDIRNHRREMAKNLKYDNYAELCMSSKMASNVDAVIEFIDSLKQRFQPVSENEFARLQEFALSEGFGDKLEPWDIPYWRNRQLNHLFPLDMESLKDYFPLKNVLQYLFNMFKTLFSLSFEDCTADGKVWADDVRFYKLFDSRTGEHLASLYTDLYGDPNCQATAEVGRDRCDLLGVTPFSYMNLNLQEPPSHQDPLLPFDKIKEIFYQFGHVLQQLATTSPHSETAGQNCIEIDSLNTIAIVSKMILSTKQTLTYMSSHKDSKSPLPVAVIDTIMKRRHHMQSYDTMQNLFYSFYDLELHTSKEHWNSIMNRVWTDFMPHPLGEGNNFPCSFTPIFSGQYAASYYSHKWAEMLACQIFKSFKKAKQAGNDQMLQVGSEFRETYLSLGGSVPADEVYRRFKKADPDPEALVGYYLRE